MKYEADWLVNKPPNNKQESSCAYVITRLLWLFDQCPVMLVAVSASNTLWKSFNPLELSLESMNLLNSRFLLPAHSSCALVPTASNAILKVFELFDSHFYRLLFLVSCESINQSLQVVTSFH